ncbi:hypothetical protein J3R83DRAFT_12547 [Lanmaoa asiatica]|nr:hypothetical protein J3R83DRAFT_12547 [Lanmaoa asiatica]
MVSFSIFLTLMPIDRSGFWSPPTTVHPSELHAPLPPGYTYHDTIPPPTTLTPTELLDKFYIARRREPDWTDPNGVLKVQLAILQRYPKHAVRSIGSSGLIAKWPRPNGLAAVPVPVRGAGSTSDGRQVAIEFRTWKRECPSIGLSLADIYWMKLDLLQGAEDIVLDRFWGRDLNFIIAWPGYQSQRSTIRTMANNGGPLTRLDLGRQITAAYARFFRKVETEKLLPKEVGFFNIALHQGLNTRSDSLGVQLMQLHLVRFRSTIGGDWVADINIV